MLYLNGKFVAQEDALISVLEPGFLLNFGLFETMRAYKNKIVYLKQHLDRLRRSCRLINIDFLYRDAELKSIIERLIELNSLEDAYVRLTVWENTGECGILVVAKEYKPPTLKQYRQGFSACVSAFRQGQDSALTNIKSNSRLFYELGWRSARSRGFNEAVILNIRGYLAEGTRSNIFFVKDKDIFTPALSCGCLDGITRGVMFDLAKDYNLKVYEGNFTLRDLYGADEAFFTNSLIGVMPLTSLDRERLGTGGSGRLSRFLMKKYNALLENDS